jgi:hypothetical protein
MSWPGGDHFADDGANRAVPPHQETEVGKVVLNLAGKVNQSNAGK